ncbi:hypothetical protein/PT repeat family protein [Blumeria hordei DH14]|uniref:AMP-activated protein kinase glycogen-binding domain-containing protein n=1 Tax=Blumeria graminis f. sp. hordei (strain DH14) TaxID=546991 RepID=N1JEI8_BLUG1|nr:hypothetical protein/PT repeat family protein [Blumeria hordei DH14]
MHLLNSEVEDSLKGVYRIEFIHKGVQPPVYIAGTFANPPWQPLEMDVVRQELSGEYKFSITLNIPKGLDHQYKFRVGEGNLWLLNEDEPIVIDDAGNRNNLLHTESNEQTWHEISVMDGREGVWEERKLTKYTVEEREKDRKGRDDEINSQDYQPRIEQVNEGEELTTPISPDLEQNTQEPIPIIKQNDVSEQINITNSDGLNLDSAAGSNNLPVADEVFPEGSSTESPLPTKLKKEEIDAESCNSKASKLDTNQDLNLFKNESTLKREETTDKDFANSAAEVADSTALLLAKDTAMPLIFDHEAGQIGYGRLSSTPMSEVANTAAEVADTAALLQSKEEVLIAPFEGNFESPEGIRFISGQSTPIEERVPQFSHECANFPDSTEIPSYPPPSFEPGSRKSSHNFSEEIDLNDPTIQMFPTDRASIIAKIQEIQERLPEDETQIEGVLLSPAHDESRRSSIVTNLAQVSLKPSPASHDCEHPRPLQSIIEEGNDKHDISNPEEPTANFGDQISVKEGSKGIGRLDNNSQGSHIFKVSELDSMKDQSDIRGGNHCAQEPTNQSQPSTKLDVKSSESGNVSPTGSPKHSLDIEPEKKQQVVSNSTPSDFNPSITLATSSEQEPPIDGEETKSYHTNKKDDIVATCPEIANDSGSREVLSSKNLSPPSEDNQAISTGVSGENSSRLNLRRPPSRRDLKASDRPITPNSIGSSKKDVKSRNFLKAFWRVIIVEWIGGMIMKLCGVGRRT